jgi:hypothetical protein
MSEFYVITGRAFVGNDPIMAKNPQWAIIGKHGNQRGSRMAETVHERIRIERQWKDLYDDVEVLTFNSREEALAFIEKFSTEEEDGPHLKLV